MMADTGGKIYQAIPAIMSEINAVGKNKKNTQQGFMYRGIDDVMNAINPALVKNKVFIVPEIIEQTREERKSIKGANLIYSICRMRFKFYAEDGSSIEAVTIGEGMDSGDKATNKAMAIAFKYACFQVFCIPTEEMRDPDAECHDVAPKEVAANHTAGVNNAGGNNRQASEKYVRGGTQQGKKTEEQENTQMKEQVNGSLINAVDVKVLKEKIDVKGLSYESILSHYGLSRFEDMTFEQWNNAMQILEKYKDKADV